MLQIINNINISITCERRLTLELVTGAGGIIGAVDTNDGWCNGSIFGGWGLLGGPPINDCCVSGDDVLDEAYDLIEFIKDGGKTFGISVPLNFKCINLHAIENSLISIFPSASVSDSALKKQFSFVYNFLTYFIIFK